MLGGRLLPLVRTPFAMTMALLGLTLPRYLSGAAPGAVLWASGPLVAGYLLRRRVEGVIGPLEGGLDAVGLGLGALLALVAIALLLRARRHARQAAMSD